LPYWTVPSVASTRLTKPLFMDLPFAPRPRFHRDAARRIRPIRFEPLESRLMLAAGWPDPTFGFIGYRGTDLLTFDDFADAVAVQKDGKIVVAGSVEQNSRDGLPTLDGSTNVDLAVARYNADGSLDTTFGPDGTGIVKTDIDGGVDIASGIAIQPGGEIIVVGQAQSDFLGVPLPSDFAVVRYTRDGRLDTSFSGDGIRLIDFADGLRADSAVSVVLHNDKIIVAGVAGRTDGTTDMGVVRLNVNGSLDDSFAGNGTTTINFFNLNDGAFGVAVDDATDDIILAGYAGVRDFVGQGFFTHADAALARLDEYGLLDSSFGFLGVRTFSSLAGNDQWKDVAIGSNGRIVAAGNRNDGVDDDIFVARYEDDGDLDSSFSTNGWLTRDFTGGTDKGEALAIQPDGKLVVAARAQGTANTDFAVLRYEADGDPDPQFGYRGTNLAGVTALDFGFNDLASDLALAGDGSIVVTGFGQGLLGADFIVARYTNDLPDSFDLQPLVGDSHAQAVNLGTVSGFHQPQSLQDLSLHDASDEDWFRFRTTGDGRPGHFVGVDFLHAGGDIDIELWDSANRRLAASRGVRDGESISLDGLSSGDYYLRIRPYGVAPNPNYGITINAPWQPGPDVVDAAAANDTRAAAYDLGLISGRQDINRLAGQRMGHLAGATLSLHQTSRPDVDWFRFQTSGAGQLADFVRLDFNPQLGNLSLLLTDEQGVICGQAAGDLGREQVSLEDLPAGIYFAGIYSAEGGTHPSYSLVIDAPGGAIPADAFEPNNRRELATNLRAVEGTVVLTPQSYQLSVHESTDEDWYRIELTGAGQPGHYIALSMNQRWGDLDLALYNASGAAVMDPSGSGRPLDSQRAGNVEEINLAGVAAGVYYVQVRGRAGAGVTNPEYTLVISAPGKDWSETAGGHPDNNATARAYDLGAVRQMMTWGTGGQPLSIAGESDEDWFAFQITERAVAGHWAQIDFTSSRGDLRLELYDASNLQAPLRVGETGGGSEGISLEGLPAKDSLGSPIRYYLRVAASDAVGVVAYTLAISAPAAVENQQWAIEDWAERAAASGNNNARTEATPLGIIRGPEVYAGSDHPLSIHQASDQDWYQFEITERASRGHVAAIAFNAWEADLDLRLFDAQGQPVPAPGGTPRAATTIAGVESISLAGLGAGAYYLLVQGYAGAVCRQYDLLINGPGAAYQDVFESLSENNNPFTPTELGVIDRQFVLSDLSLDRAGDEDWFRFELTTAGGKLDGVEIEFDQSLGDIDLSVITPIGHLLISEGAADFERISLAGHPAGVYRVAVTGRFRSGEPPESNPSYRLLISRAASDGDWAEEHAGSPHNDTQAAAHDLRRLDRSQTLNGLSIHRPGDEDWFRFELPVAAVAGNEVGIRHIAMLGDLDLAVYRHVEGNLVLVDRPSAPGDLERVSLAGLLAGVYYIQVTGYRQATQAAYDLYLSTPPPRSGPDWTEDIGTVNLHRVEGVQVLTGLSLHHVTDGDGFRFELTEAPRQGHNIQINFDHQQGDLNLWLTRLDDPNTPHRRASGEGDREEVSLAGLPPGSYLLAVLGEANPQYTLLVNAPQTAAADWAESGPGRSDNNAQPLAEDLRLVTGTMSLSELSITAGDDDWYRFQLSVQGAGADSVVLEYDPTGASLAMDLVRADGTRLPARQEQSGLVLSLVGLAPGDYWLHVRGTEGQANPSYALSLQTGAASLPDWAEQKAAGGSNDVPARAVDLRSLDAAVSQPRRYRDPFSDSTGCNGDLDCQMQVYSKTMETERSKQNHGLGGMDGPGNPMFGTSGINYQAINPSLGNLFFLSQQDRLRIFNTDPRILAQGAFGSDPATTGNFIVSGAMDPWSLNKNPALSQYDDALCNHPMFANGVPDILNLFTANPCTKSAPPYPLGFVPAQSFAQPPFFQPPPFYPPPIYPPPLYHPPLYPPPPPFINPLGNHGVGGPIPLVGLSGIPSFGAQPPWTGPPPPAFGPPPGPFGGGPFAPPPSNTCIHSPLPFLQQMFGGTQCFAAPESAVRWTIGGLTITPGDEDWFIFELDNNGQTDQYVEVVAEDARGRLALSLWQIDASGNRTLLDQTDGNADQQRLPLAGLPAGDFYIQVRALGAEPSANSDYSLSLTIPRPAVADLMEPNNSRPGSPQAEVRDLRTIDGVRVLTGLSLHCQQPAGASSQECQAADEDWFVFSTLGPAQPGHQIRIDFDHRLGDLELVVLDSAGQPLTVGGRQLSPSTSGENFEQIELAGLPQGTYAIGVYGYRGVAGNLVLTNPSYSLTIVAPETITPDGMEPNNATTANTAGVATDLGDISQARAIAGLTIHEEDIDYFRFTIGQGTPLSSRYQVGIQYQPSLGALELDIVNSAHVVVPGLSRTITATSNRLALSGLFTDANADGRQDVQAQYFVRVRASGGDQNRYALQFELPSQEPAGAGAWTLLVYMTASDLGGFAQQTINELELAASQLPPEVSIAVMLDQSAAEPFETPWQQHAQFGHSAWSDAGWAVIQPDSDPSQVATIFQRVGERDSGSAATLTEFVAWALTQASAERYGLILWNHGDGAAGLQFDDRGGEDGQRMKVRDLAQALSRIDLGQSGGAPRRFDLIALDACLMAMAEVAHAVAPYTEAVVASQDVEMAIGYDYRLMLAGLSLRPDLVTGRELAAQMVLSYQTTYQGNPHGADTHSAIDVSQAATFTARMADFTAAVRDHAQEGDWLLLRQARLAATAFQNHPDYRDLGQFLTFLGRAPVRPAGGQQGLAAEINAAAQAALNALGEMVSVKTIDARRVSGLSIFLPQPGADPAAYLGDHASFAQASGWGGFLTEFLGAGGAGTALDFDWAESNDVPAHAHHLQRLAGAGHQFENLTLHKADDRDWFQFFIQAVGGATDRVTVSLPPGSTASLQVQLCDAARVQCVSATGNQPMIALAGRSPGAYLVEVAAIGGTLTAYSVTVDAPGSAAAADDPFRGNDQAAKRADLGAIASETVFSGLASGPTSEDWYRFSTPKNYIFAGGSGAGQNRWQVEVSIVGAGPLSARLAPRGGGQPFEVTGSGKLLLPYQSGSGAAYDLAIFNTSTVGNSYILRLLQSPAAILPNQPPSFLSGPMMQVFDDAGAQSVAWATAISAGPPEEADQSVVFVVATDRPDLFVAAPQIEPSGRLTYTPAPNVEGMATVTVLLQDNGGTASGGQDTSLPAAFTISVNKLYRWHNARRPLDVNDSGGLTPVTALDALVVFNLLNASRSSANIPVEATAVIGNPFFYDTSRDNFVSAIDALRVINFLNAQATGEGERASAAEHELDQGGSLVEAIDLLMASFADLDARRLRRRPS
jgi:uncharacterized delta-60 repeat protein